MDHSIGGNLHDGEFHLEAPIQIESERGVIRLLHLETSKVPEVRASVVHEHDVPLEDDIAERIVDRRIVQVEVMQIAVAIPSNGPLSQHRGQTCVDVDEGSRRPRGTQLDQVVTPMLFDPTAPSLNPLDLLVVGLLQIVGIDMHDEGMRKQELPTVEGARDLERHGNAAFATIHRMDVASVPRRWRDLLEVRIR